MANPDTMHPLLVDVEEKQELVSTLFAGTTAMREAAQDYLPQEPGETTANYTNRLERSVLFPAYKLAVKSNTGKLFTKEVIVTGADEQLAGILIAVDEDDNDITEFAKQSTENAINNGCSYILVDYPVMNDNSTLEDEIAAGGRPYWVNIKQTQVLEASPVKKLGKNVLGVFRYKESVAERVDEFTVNFVDQIKQFQFDDKGLVEYLVFRKDQQNEWFLFDSGQLIASNGTQFDEIPIVAINVDPIGFFLGQPVFYDLAEENKQHWQMASDYNNIVHHSQVPMLVVKGVTQSFDDNADATNQVIISPNSVIELSNPEANVSWVEVSGKASEVGQKAISASMRRMSVMSLQLLVNVDSSATATASKIDAKESLSILQSIGKIVQQALIKAIGFTHKYNGTSDASVLVEINLDDALIFGDANDVTSLLTMNEQGLLTKKTTLDEFKRRGVISENIDTQTESVAATAEMPVEETPQAE